MSHSVTPRTERIDFRATSDPALHERIAPSERVARMSGLSSFFVGEQRVEAELGPLMRAVPDEDMRIFLSTQIADEARHAPSRRFCRSPRVHCGA